MSQKRKQMPLPQQSWRGDDEIISMETRILPKITPYSTARSIAQVQIPLRQTSQSSATPPVAAMPLFSSSKRPQSSDSSMDPTPCKRHRIDLLKPKDEPQDHSAPIALPRNGNNSADLSAMSSRAGTSVETPSTEPAKQSYVHGLGAEMIYFRFSGQILPSPIHRKVLCEKVPAFKEELKRLQPNENILDFPEGMCATFEALIEWAYREKLPKVTKSTTVEESHTMIQLYCLAGRYREADLMNACVDYIIRYLKKGRPRWTIQWIGYVYENTSRASPLRALMMKWFMEKMKKTQSMSRWTTEEFAEVAKAHPDMIHDFFALFRTLDVHVGNPRADDSRVYYITDDDLSLSPEAEVDRRDESPLTMYTAGSPDEYAGSPPMESTPPTTSDEMESEDKESNFAEDPVSSDSEVADDYLPMTRSGRKKSSYKKRAFTAPA